MASPKKQKRPSESGDDLKSLETAGPNMAAVLLKQDELVMKEVPMPSAPGPHQVLLSMKCVGICGSDVHYWTHGRIGDFVVHAPMVLGHESAGIVVAVGSEVSHLKPGDRVALEPGIPCRHCEICKSGRYNLCDKMAFFATPPIDGSLANFVTHDADMCFKLPDNVSLEEGAMCEPLSVGVAACRKANVQPGSRVLIMGAGPIGVICMLVAKAFGATHVYLTDVMDERLAMATKLGAAGVFNAKQPEADMVQAIIKQAGHLDMAIECSGHESATRVALQCVKSGGTLCLVGLHQFEQRLPIFQVAVREVDIKGIFRYCNTYPTCISLLASGAVNVQPLITHRYRISSASNDLLRGFTHAKSMADGALKIMFHLGDGQDHTARTAPMTT